ncbi:MAG: hypothetical protein QW752_02800 [Thermoplasmata archaeon]
MEDSLKYSANLSTMPSHALASIKKVINRTVYDESSKYFSMELDEIQFLYETEDAKMKMQEFTSRIKKE